MNRFNLDMEQFLQGVEVGRRLKVLRLSQVNDDNNKEPVAFLYKGVNKDVILPKLPEVEGKQKAFIWKKSVFGVTYYFVYLISEPYYKVSSDGGYAIGCRIGDVGYQAKENDTEWTNKTVYESDRLICTPKMVFWANFPVKDENGDVVLDKSDPIPVY